jgi:predicted DNA-binding transcriptional regulator AlpA
MKILRITAVLDETGHRSHATIYNAVKEGLFTKPVRIGQRAVGWPQAEYTPSTQPALQGSQMPRSKRWLSSYMLGVQAFSFRLYFDI